MEMTPPPARGSRIAGYLFAVAAGSLWGMTGPLSTALYNQGAAITGIGFWRLLLGIAGLLVYGAFKPDLFRADLKGWLMVGLGGGVLVAMFELGYQYAIAGAGVAGAAALLYTAPVIVALLAKPLLGEKITPIRLLLAVLVMVGATLTIKGGSNAGAESASRGLAAGVVGGGLAALSYAGTTLLARWAVPRYGVAKVLFLEIVGGAVVLFVVLGLWHQTPQPPATPDAWVYVAVLAAATVLAANFLFFNATRRIEAAPTAVAATIEPVMAALLAFLLFQQRLAPYGALGLLMVVGGVAGGYLQEWKAQRQS
ncbi:MAG TPA: EamA family transporter [Gemmatimonadales bacterium]|nr:EamA family transporter [Gemmatimonadales bacterium]